MIDYDTLHPPRLVACPVCGKERLVRQDHPALDGESAPCAECREQLRAEDGD